MIKAMFPIIILLALELVPVVKSYANIKSKYGDNLAGLTAQVQPDSAIAGKLDEIEKSLGMAEKKPAEAASWF